MKKLYFIWTKYVTPTIKKNFYSKSEIWADLLVERLVCVDSITCFHNVFLFNFFNLNASVEYKQQFPVLFKYYHCQSGWESIYSTQKGLPYLLGVIIFLMIVIFLAFQFKNAEDVVLLFSLIKLFCIAKLPLDFFHLCLTRHILN